MSELLLGIDVGTSSVKALVCDTMGRFVAQAEAAHDLQASRPGWAEESPAQWWQNTVHAIRQCLAHPGVSARNIAAVGVTGMLPAVVLLDDEGNPLRPAILQNDARALDEIAHLGERIDAQTFFEMTGASLSQQSVGPKLLWLQRHEPELWARTRTILGSYDYINLRLTGARAVEANWALESGLYDLQARDWSPALLAAANTPAHMLPAIHKPSDVIGGVSTEAAALTGLRASTPVVAGSADHVGAAFAAGIKDDGDLLIKFGSAGDVLYATDELIFDPRLYVDYHNIPGKFLLNGCMATSGSLIKWLVRELFVADVAAAEARGAKTYEQLDAEAARLPAGSDGLIVLPYFLGEKTPLLDPQARGVFFGLTLFHNRYHLYRAALEGVVYGFKHHVQVLQEMGQSPRRVVAGEGGARSPLWRQIAADALGLPVTYLANNPGAALAAAYVAGMGVGAFDAWDDVDRFVAVEDTMQPDAGNHARYETLFALYRDLYDHLRDDFRRLPRS